MTTKSPSGTDKVALYDVRTWDDLLEAARGLDRDLLEATRGLDRVKVQGRLREWVLERQRLKL